MAAFAELIAEGKVRAIGASNYTAPRLQEALATSARLGLPRYESLQPLYNLMDRAAYEADLEPLCRQEGLGVINFYGLASGFLTGKYRSEADLAKSARGARCKAYLTARGHRVLAALDAIAQTHHATPAQVALAWQIARPGLTAPIASATSTAQWAELASAARLQHPGAQRGQRGRVSHLQGRCWHAGAPRWRASSSRLGAMVLNPANSRPARNQCRCA